MKQRCTSAGAGNRISSNKRLGSGSENLPRVTQLGHCIRTPILEYLVVLHCSLLVVAIAFQLISKKKDTYPNASADHRRKDEWAAARATGEGILKPPVVTSKLRGPMSPWRPSAGAGADSFTRGSVFRQQPSICTVRGAKWQ